MQQPATEDSFFNTLARDLGIAAGEPEAAPAPVEKPPVTTIGLTLGEHTRMLDEKKVEGEKPAEPGKEEPAKPEDKAKETPATPATDPAKPAEPDPAKPAEAPKAGTEPQEKPIVVEKKKPTEDLVKEQVRKILEEEKANTPAPTTPVQPEPPKMDDYEAGLTEAQKEELLLARAAAKKNPAKYGKLPDQTLAFYRKTDEYLDKARQDENAAERTFDERDTDFQKFLRQNKPAFDVVDRRRIEKDLIIEEAETRAAKKYEQEQAEMKQKLHLLEVQPKIEAGVSEFQAGLEGLLAENESTSPVLKQVREVGWQKAAESDPVFAPIVDHYRSLATNLAGEYLAMIGGAKKFDPQNQSHLWMIEFIRKQGNDFHKNGGDQRVKDGKEFLPVAEYSQAVQKDPSAAERYWTFEPRDVLTRLASNTAANIDHRIKTEEEKLVKAGFERKKPGAPAPTPTPTPAPAIPKTETTPAKKPEEQSPKATTSASPGVAKSSEPVVRKAMDDWALAALGVPKVT